MFSFVNFDFMFDEDALDAPHNIIVPNQVNLRHGIIEHFNLNANTTNPWTGEIPTEWAVDTIMDCDFQGTISAGNLGFMREEVSAIRVKRRKAIDPSEDSTSWITLFELPITSEADFSFSVIDHFAKNNTEYVYGLVPVVKQNQSGVIVELEGDIAETDAVLSEFNGVFICDSDSFVKLYAGVSYDNIDTIQTIGVHNTLGSTYPIVVANSKNKYQQSGITGEVLNPEAYKVGGQIDRNKITIERKRIENFLTTKTPKVIKDWNGNMWLVFFTDNITFTPDNNWGMGIGTINGSWTEIGDAESGTDLRNAGLVGGGS